MDVGGQEVLLVLLYLVDAALEEDGAAGVCLVDIVSDM